MCLIIFEQLNFPSLLQQHVFSDDMFTDARAGPTPTRDPPIANHNNPTIQSIPHEHNQVSPSFFVLFKKLFHSDVRHIRKDKRDFNNDYTYICFTLKRMSEVY